MLLFNHVVTNQWHHSSLSPPLHSVLAPEVRVEAGSQCDELEMRRYQSLDPFPLNCGCLTGLEDLFLLCKCFLLLSAQWESHLHSLHSHTHCSQQSLHWWSVDSSLCCHDLSLCQWKLTNQVVQHCCQRQSHLVSLSFEWHSLNC